jgi:glycosyltransferase involved in cell wall biosynthesis
LLVSILIPCYNAERWVAGAIESALAQTWPEKEVIVVDDGSTDGSLNVIKQFGNRIQWETGPNRGGNTARNRLADLASGEWLQYLDADDYLLPEKVARQVEFLAAAPDSDIVYGPVTVEYWSENEVRREREEIPEPHDPWVLLVRWFLPQTGCSLWLRNAIYDVGGWKVGQPCCQEHELYLRLLAAGKRFAYCDHGGAVYRRWSQNTVCTRDTREVRRRRLEIVQNAQNFLAARNSLSRVRLTAINQARFETARAAWQCDREESLHIMRLVSNSQPEFLPSGFFAHPAYLRLYRLLGFRLTEFIGDLKRLFKSARQ